MRISNFAYYLRESWQGIYRNGWMSFASLVVIVLTLLILGSFMLINLNIQAITDTIKNQVEIIVYIDEATEEPDEVERLRLELLAVPGVQQLTYVTKDEALERLRERLGDRSGITDGLERNPLPSSFEVRPHDPEQVGVLAESIRGLAGVESVDYGQEVVDQLMQVTHSIQIFGIAIIGLLGIISLFLIANTIKLTVFSRRRQINIMKFVGATDWFIRWPFILEGVFLGILGALITYLLLFYGYSQLYAQGSAWLYHNFLSVEMVKPELAGMDLLKVLFALGAGIGAVGSGISVRKFLKV